MSMRRILWAVLAGVGTLAAALPAQADFTFSTTSGGSIPFDSGSTLVLTGQPTSQTLNFQQNINIQDVEVTTGTPAQNLINVTVPFSFTLTVNQFPGLQPSTPTTSGTVTVTGSIHFTRSDVGGELSQLVSLTIPTLVLGNTTYTFAAPSYTPPTVNSAANSVGAGNLSILITPTVVPEPASVALLGMGAVGLLGVTLRRRMIRARLG